MFVGMMLQMESPGAARPCAQLRLPPQDWVAKGVTRQSDSFSEAQGFWFLTPQLAKCLCAFVLHAHPN